ncbi:MAG: hypothetical protein KJN71_06235, partial [Acidimicrobiia bacterium]|nr:hypothetical protein [Acidimicrobiia bacterium]
LHAYAQVVGAMPRAFAEAHPKWWHVSLKVTDHGLTTDPMPLLDGGTASIVMDLAGGTISVRTAGETTATIPMTDGLSARVVGERLSAALGELGLAGDIDTDRFANDDERPFDAGAAASFWDVARLVASTFEEHLSGLSGDVGIVQLWPHGFDLSFEWFGTRVETHEENGETTDHPAQLNLGFYPGGQAYFYSNPWPFDADALLGVALPHGAQWHTEGWEGSILRYEELAGDPDGPAKLAEYARAVFEAASPTLMA